MTDQLSDAHAFAASLKRDFVSDGYESVNPSLRSAELPPGYTPDLMFQRGDEVVVVEIKSREEHRSVETLRGLKQSVEQVPNWHFRLYVVPPGDPADPPQDNLQDIEKLMATANRLNRDGQFEAASVVLWMEIEVCMRTLLTNRQDRPNPGVGGMSMARRLRDYGDLNEDDLDLLERASAARNLSAHGYRLHPHDPLAPELLALARTLGKKARSATVSRE